MYAPNNNDKKLTELIQKSNKQCIEIKSKRNIQTDNHYETFCLEAIPIDTFCYLLSYLSSTNLTTIQSVFYSAIQKPGTNIVLNGDLLFRTLDIMKGSPNADTVGLYHSDITFLSKYSSIQFSASSNFKRCRSWN